MPIKNDDESKDNPTETPATGVNGRLNDAAKTAGVMAGKVFVKAKGFADQAVKTATSDTTKQNLTDAAKTAGVMTGKVLVKAKGLADQAVKTATSDTTKQNLNDAAKTAGAMFGKVFAKAKGFTDHSMKTAAADATTTADAIEQSLSDTAQPAVVSADDSRQERSSNTGVVIFKPNPVQGFWTKLIGKLRALFNLK